VRGAEGAEAAERAALEYRRRPAGRWTSDRRSRLIARGQAGLLIGVSGASGFAFLFLLT
jgi:hypothetical protein